jgi:hypothetical protein
MGILPWASRPVYWYRLFRAVPDEPRYWPDRILFAAPLGSWRGLCFAKNRMKTARCSQPAQLSLALHALKEAILKGTTWQYEKLVTLAVNAGATDEQIDLVAHEAIEALFARAERPITPRSLTQLMSSNQFRG